MSGAAKIGRPAVYSLELADKICELLGDGESLLSISKLDGMPGYSTVMRWLEQDHDGFRDKYARARDVQAHVRAEMAVEKAETAKDAALGRLAYDALRWHAGKLLPKVYGDKSTTEVQNLGANGQPVDPAPLVVRFVNAEDGKPK